MDNLLVGKFLGTTLLGNYSKSYQLLSFPITIFLNVINPVMQPILAEHEKNVVLIRDTYLKVCRLLAIVAIPVSIFFSLNAGPIIYLLFGKQWSMAILPLSILSLSICPQMLSQSMSAIWQSRNLTKIQSVSGFISLGIISLCIFIGILGGNLTSVSIAVSGSYFLNFIVSGSLLMRRALDSNFFQLFKVIIKPLFLGIILSVIVILTNPYISFSNLFITLLLRGIVWLIIVALFLVVTGEFKKIKEMVKK